jgi:vancomycin resistance protein YoaR
VTQKPQRENQGGRVVVLTILGLAILVGGAYVAAYAFAGDKLPRGAEVAGIDIGGRERDDAIALLEEAFAGRDAVSVAVEGEPTKIQAETLGLSVDYAASVEAAGGGRSWEPSRLWDYYTGGDHLDPVIIRDDAVMEEALERLDAAFGKPAREGDVTFEGGNVQRVLGKPGNEIDRSTASDELEAAYASGGTAELTLGPAQPEIDENDVQDAMNEFANPAVSGPVVLEFDTARVRLSPAEFAPALGMKPEGGELVPDLHEGKLNRIVHRELTGADGAPVDATVRLVDGSPRVIPSKPGVSYEPSDVADAFLELVVRDPGERRMAVKATVENAEFTTKDARRLRIKERVSSFTTYYPYAEYRNINIGRAAELVNGTVLKPGETFSLNGTVGERTAANGFTKGFIISDGVFKEDFGGGVSQMATTTFNAMFFAGLEDVEHKPHSFYIDRYPVGREATVAWGSVDLRFKNTTPYGVLIEAHVTPSTPSSQGVVTVSMWSTDYWDITTRTGERYNFTEPKTRTITDEDCEPNDGYGGFDIDIWRYFHRAGSDKVVRTEKMHTHYTPSDTVICKPPSPQE